MAPLFHHLFLWFSGGVLLLFFSSVIASAEPVDLQQSTTSVNSSQQHLISYLTRGATVPGSANSGNTVNNSPSLSCPKWLNCTAGFFDEGKDCKDESGNGRSVSRVCSCIAHCCHAFDCRHWGRLVQCRRKCGAARPTRFGRSSGSSSSSSSGSLLDQRHQQQQQPSSRCEPKWNACERDRLDLAWDARGASEAQRNCIGHCCFAFDCRRALGYCRAACGVEVWVTPRPLG